MTLHLSNPHQGLDENASAVSNLTRSLVRGRDCNIFALRLRERPPEPPERLLEFAPRQWPTACASALQRFDAD